MTPFNCCCCFMFQPNQENGLLLRPLLVHSFFCIMHCKRYCIESQYYVLGFLSLSLFLSRWRLLLSSFFHSLSISISLSIFLLLYLYRFIFVKNLICIPLSVGTGCTTITVNEQLILCENFK